MQFGVFWTTGQICSATSRVLVHSSLLPAFKSRLKERSEAICIADPQTPESRMGPIVNKAQYDKVMASIEVRCSGHCWYLFICNQHYFLIVERHDNVAGL